MSANGPKVSFWGDKNLIKLESGDCGTTTGLYNIKLYVNYSSTMLSLKKLSLATISYVCVSV